MGFNYIVVVVTIVHLMIIFGGLIVESPRINPIKNEPKLVVRTVLLKQEIIKTSTPQTKKTPEPQVKKTASPQIKKAPEPRKQQNSKKEKLLKKAQESIAKISRNSHKYSAKIKNANIPGEIKELKIETGLKLSSQESLYKDALTKRLQEQMLLPEFGNVKVELTLNRMGKVVNVIIVKSESEKNKNYIKKTLQALNFPPFGNHFKNKKEYTFQIILSS